MRIMVAAVGLACLAATATARSTESDPATMGMVQVEVDGGRLEGMPLAWGSNVVHLLGRDGQILSFDPSKATDSRQSASRFRPYSISELRANLLRELGGGYDVSGTSHYLVAHPRGQGDRWAQRFEDLYRSFVRYFSVRGFELQEPPFPLIGVVCRDRAEFERYAAGQGIPSTSGAVGLYDLKSNRIIVYDLGQEAGGKGDWQRSASTVVHEATHQMAFNTGIHNRYCPPPLWVVEGLATLFEAAGVHDARSYMSQKDRVNRERLRDYQAMLSDKHDGRLPAELIAHDRYFRTSTMAAYAEAWALTFYLMETQPRQLARYLALTASHAPFTDYSPEARLADFTSVFGSDWRLLDAQFGRFMQKVK